VLLKLAEDMRGAQAECKDIQQDSSSSFCKDLDREVAIKYKEFPFQNDSKHKKNEETSEAKLSLRSSTDEKNSTHSAVDWALSSLESLELLRQKSTYDSSLIDNVQTFDVSFLVQKQKPSSFTLVHESTGTKNSATRSIHFQEPSTGIFRSFHGGNIEVNGNDDDACMREIQNVHERREGVLNSMIIRQAKGADLWLKGILAGFCMVAFFDDPGEEEPNLIRQDIGVEQFYFILIALALSGSIIKYPIKRKAGLDLHYFVGILISFNYFLAMVLTLSVARGCVILQKDDATQQETIIQIRTNNAVAAVRAISCIIPWTASTMVLSWNLSL